ncbi:hypothetical protein [Nocardia fluminea]|uniref:hypothetical protein n=1 Tax=Nocardia fluminea TaxID=134984 RepID=UPI00364F56D8
MTDPHPDASGGPLLFRSHRHSDTEAVTPELSIGNQFPTFLAPEHDPRTKASA